MKADEPRHNRIPFMLSDGELDAIDNWRFENRIGTRAEAIRRLVQLGLVLDGRAHAVQSAFDALSTTVEEIADENVRIAQVQNIEVRDLQMLVHLMTAFHQLSKQLEPVMVEMIGLSHSAEALRSEGKTDEVIERTQAAVAEYFQRMRETLEPFNQAGSGDAS